MFAGRPLSLSNVEVIPDPRPERHGVLGQDVLRSGAGYILDLQALYFKLLPPD